MSSLVAFGTRFAERGNLTDFYLNVGDEVVQERWVTGAAIDAFADVNGDHSPNHVRP